MHNNILFKILQTLSNFIYPTLCVSCKKIIDDRNSFLCPECWNKLKFIQQPCCNICSMPLKYKVSENDICPSCIRKTPLYSQAKAIFAYNDTIAKMIYGFKYYDKTHLVRFFADVMAKRGTEVLDKVDVIVPVPLHKNRLGERKYNQSALLAKEIGKLTGKKCVLDFLRRKKDTTPQVRLKGRERYKNLKRSFEVNAKYLKEIEKKLALWYNNKSFMLIDDVMTTGTTINECTKALLHRGASSVYVLTVAKTVWGTGVN